MTDELDERIIDYVRSFIASRRFAPTVREIAAGVGFKSPGSTHKRLENLRDLGRIEFEERSPRTIRIIDAD